MKMTIPGLGRVTVTMPPPKPKQARTEPIPQISYVYGLDVPDEHGMLFAVGHRDQWEQNRTIATFLAVGDAHIFARALTAITGHELMVLPSAEPSTVPFIR